MSALAAIAARAQEGRLSWLIAGGHAVIAHGYRRNTFDLDIIIRRNDREQWMVLARSLGYVFFHEGPSFVQFNAADAQGLPLDMMMVNGETFEKLAAGAGAAPPSVGDAKVVSLLHLLALKCHAIKHGHKGRIVKDVDDVIRLVQANRVDMDNPEVRALFLKHGTPELYEKVRHVCRES